jgi:putative ABC transport system permease protein
MLHRLPWRQLTYEKLRLFAAAAGITFAVLLQLMQFGFRDALFISSVLVHDHLRADLFMVSPQYEFIVASESFPRQRLNTALGFADVDSVGSLLQGITLFRDPVTRLDHQVLLLAFSPDNPAFDLGSMNSDINSIRVADAVLFDARSRAEFRPLIDRIRAAAPVRAEIAGQRIDLNGVFDLGVSFTGNAHMLTSDTTFRRLLHRPEGSIDIGLVRLKPGSDVDAVKSALAAALPSDVNVLNRQEFAALEQSYWNRNQPIGFIFNMAVVVGLSVGAVIVYQILYTDVTSHLPEYATLKAMGYRDRALSLVVLQQALILSVLGFPVGFFLSIGLYNIARQTTGLPIFMTTARAVMVFGLTVLMCGVSGLLAMRKLKSADPADAF